MPAANQVFSNNYVDLWDPGNLHLYFWRTEDCPSLEPTASAQGRLCAFARSWSHFREDDKINWHNHGASHKTPGGNCEVCNTCGSGVYSPAEMPLLHSGIPGFGSRLHLPICADSVWEAPLMARRAESVSLLWVTWIEFSRPSLSKLLVVASIQWGSRQRLHLSRVLHLPKRKKMPSFKKCV